MCSVFGSKVPRRYVGQTQDETGLVQPTNAPLLSAHYLTTRMAKHCTLVSVNRLRAPVHISHRKKELPAPAAAAAEAGSRLGPWVVLCSQLTGS